MIMTTRPVGFFNQLNAMTTFASAANVPALSSAFNAVSRNVLPSSGIALNASTEFPQDGSPVDRYVNFRDGIVDKMRPHLDEGIMRVATDLHGANTVINARKILLEGGLSNLESLPNAIMSARAIDVISEAPVQALERSAREYLGRGVVTPGKRSIARDYMFRRGIFEYLLTRPAEAEKKIEIDPRPLSKELIPAIRNSTYLGMTAIVVPSVAVIAVLGIAVHPVAALVGLFSFVALPISSGVIATMRELREVTGR